MDKYKQVDAWIKEQLKILSIRSGMNPMELAKEIGMSHTTYYDHRNVPSEFRVRELRKLDKIARKYGMTVIDDSTIFYDDEHLVEQLDILAIKAHIKTEQMAEIAGVSPSTYSQRRKAPGWFRLCELRKLDVLANHFGVQLFAS